ncbi:hypothetical protein [Paenibacillus sp. YYML68]|uniref:hypothetical protein n=1 Tax=Paenibacillus sp. YYML68 TaxID=2909250 RepID=UPI0024901290|nr:hypothetical protein [Paenibacillus sp. YYML68]
MRQRLKLTLRTQELRQLAHIMMEHNHLIAESIRENRAQLKETIERNTRQREAVQQQLQELRAQLQDNSRQARS